MNSSQRFAEHVGITVSDGTVTVATDDRHTNTRGGIQGGLIATLLDIAMGEAVRATLEEGQGAATLQLSVTYLNEAEPGDTLQARAEVGKRGRSIVLLSAGVVTDDGRDIAEAVGTFTIVDKD